MLKRAQSLMEVTIISYELVYLRSVDVSFGGAQRQCGIGFRYVEVRRFDTVGVHASFSHSTHVDWLAAYKFKIWAIFLPLQAVDGTVQSPETNDRCLEKFCRSCAE